MKLSSAEMENIAREFTRESLLAEALEYLHAQNVEDWISADALVEHVYNKPFVVTSQYRTWDDVAKRDVLAYGKATETLKFYMSLEDWHNLVADSVAQIQHIEGDNIT